jgi:hypothetical protein
MAVRERKFLEARYSGLRIVHRSDIDPAHVAQAIAQHRENARDADKRCESYGPGSSVSRIVVDGRFGELDLAVKWNHWRGLRGALSDLFNGSRAARAVIGAERLREIGLLYPETFAIAERRRFGLVTESFLLTRFLPYASPLPAILPTIRGVPKERRALAYALGDLVGKLHAAHLDHADLKHSNLLVTPEHRFVLLDLDSLARSHRPGWRRRVRALGQLEAFAFDLYPWLPRTDRFRFLEAYLQREPSLRPERRELIASVQAWVARRLSKWAQEDRRSHIRFPLAPRKPPGNSGDPARRPGSAEPV